jgi:hypothetical protein
MTMAMRGPLRLLTLVAICAVSIPAAFRGASIAHFAVTQIRVSGGSDGMEALRGWRDTNGVAAAARDPALLGAATDQEALARQKNALKDYLAVKPLSPFRWLALADAELSSGGPIDVTIRDYEMSVITGPYEGYLMSRRAMLGLLLWEKLGPDERIGAARDLALGDFSPSQMLVVKGILGAKTKETRDSVRFQILQVEGLQANRLDRLGLTSVAPPEGS